MLDLSKVYEQVQAMSEAVLESRSVMTERVSLSASLLRESAWKELSNRVAESKTSMLTAIPMGSLSEVKACSAPPRIVSVVATDGSQIVPDHHGPALCFLLNTGRVMIQYGSGQRVLLDHIPELFYREEDIYLEVNGRQVLIQGELLAAKRTELEAYYLEGLIEAAVVSNHPVVALEDGSLIKWNLDQSSDWQAKVLQRYLVHLSRARTWRAPVCGYLSGSRACDVINSLKLILCPESPVNCDKCQFKGADAPCQRLQGVTDITLFRQLLRLPGDRSQVFLSSSRILQEYGDNKVGFYYLNVSSEIARVEIPWWVYQDKLLLDLTQSVIMDQAEKGKGYPLVLTEAHEQAVIKGADRDAFLRLVETSLIKSGAPAASTPKLLRKRISYI